MNPFHIPELAKRYTQYDMIKIHTVLPEFPASRTRLLCAFLHDPADDGAHKELYALATSLVQMGIDTHEMVSVSNAVKEKKAVRSRQMKVLAGDYFSSGFYQILSQAGQIEMVRQLSAAICEVNRLKMSLYTRMKQLKLSAEDYIQQTVHIRTQMFMHFGQLMKGAKHKLWPDVLTGVARCEVLAGEIGRCDDLVTFPGSWGFWHIMQNGTGEERRHLGSDIHDEEKLRPILEKYDIKGKLYAMLEEQVQYVYGKAKQSNSENLMQEMIQIGEPFLRLVRTPKVLEER
ncbi:MAG: heptaprenyl diphosphate synthase component I-like protein [Paenibacillaceae bacterium]|jgi:heptaprenyl diphosphate synthase|nr:heptaprenyl diphosphate synthase component I-like protein [Paenibacillaceae bacterium]